MRYIVWAILFSALSFGVCSAGDDSTLKDQKDKESYSLGFQVGESYRKRGLDLNSDIFIKGIQDGFSGTVPQLSRDEMEAALKRLKNKAHAAQYSRSKSLKQQREEAKEFLAANAKKPGVVTLPSGLQYKVIREGIGKTPGPRDTVTVHYRGTRIDGTEFDSSYKNNKPATFRVDGVIAGWTEALQMMKEGSKWQLFIPPDLAYGKRGPMAHRTLIFDVELISVQSSEK
jgi:FKBP-type peptidyl-prolyl cis-trans isomerase FklB